MVAAAPIRTGLVGFGLSGQVFHEPFLATNPAFSIEVIATGNPARAALAAARYPVVASPDDLLSRSLDLVVLASPPAAHAQQAIAAMEAGAAVVVDKPFAPSVADAERMIEASEPLQTPLIVFQNRRWDGDFLTVARLVESGILGRIHRYESTFEKFSGVPRDRWQDTSTIAQGAGITFDLSSHLVDQALHLFGPAKLGHAEVGIVRDGGVSDDDAFLSLAHESGVISHLTVSRVAAQSGPRFRVLGSDNAYTVYGLDPQEPTLRAGGRPTDPGFGETPESLWGVVGGGLDPLMSVRTERGNYAGFYDGVAATLREGMPVPVEPQSALAALRILEAAHVASPV